MIRYVAFLRAINVGGHTVKMAALRELFESMGFSDVQTFIASGNVIFRTSSQNPAVLRQKIEKKLTASLGFEVATFLRSDSEVTAIARYSPFDKKAVSSAGAYCVGFLSPPLPDGLEARIKTFKTDIDNFHVHGSEIYWLCRKQQHESTFSNNRFEKALNCRSTFRGVNTVVKLAELLIQGKKPF